MWIAGTENSNGTEYHVFDDLAEALNWMLEMVQDGFKQDELRLYQAKKTPFSLDLRPTITANGLTI